MEAAAAREAAAREETTALRARVAEVEASEAALLTLVSRHVGGAQQAASRRLDLLLRRAQLLAAQSTDTGGRAPADERAQASGKGGDGEGRRPLCCGARGERGG